MNPHPRLRAVMYVWYWYINDQERWYAPKEFVKWQWSQPLENGTTCGHLWSFETEDAVWNMDCDLIKPYICEYRDSSVLFRSKMKGVRGTATTTVSEHTTKSAIRCAILCNKLPLCQSFSYTKQQLCALHFVPALELATELLTDAEVFDIED